MKTAEIKKFVEDFMKSHDEDTFIPNENGVFIYHSNCGQSAINLKVFFAMLLEDFISEHPSQFKPKWISDREIEIKSASYANGDDGTFYSDNCHDFQNGAKWMQEQIKNQVSKNEK